MLVKKKSFESQFVILHFLEFGGQKINNRKRGFMYSLPLNRTLDFFQIYLVTFEN